MTDGSSGHIGDVSRSIAANFGALLTGEALARAVAFGASLYLARTLGVQGFGLVEIGLAVLVYVQLFVDGGLETAAARTVARDPQRRAQYADNLIALRLLLALVAVAAVGGVALTWTGSTDLGRMIFRFTVAVVPGAFALGWAFQASARMRAVAAGSVITQVVYLAAVLLLVRGPADALSVPWAYGAGVTAGTLAVAGWYTRRYGAPRPRADLPFWRTTAIDAAPMAGSRALRAVSFNFDLLLLGYLASSSVVAYYAAAYRLVMVPILVFATFFTALFPILVRMSETERRRAVRWLLAGAGAVSVGAAAALTIGATSLLRLAMGEAFTPAGPALRLLAWSMPMTAMAGIFRQLLLARRQQHVDLAAVMAGAAVNVSLNLVLIPRFGIQGAAVATIAGEAVVLAAAGAAVLLLPSREPDSRFISSMEAGLGA